MRITKFKPGDIITRTQKCIIDEDTTDRSYIGSRMILTGLKNGLIILELDHYGVILLPEDEWAEGWNYYPDDIVSIAEDSLKEREAARMKHLTVEPSFSSGLENRNRKNINKYF
jgi:hypothetical protein